ncbi:hypothetical protein T484DRAFT_1888874 [Baffinella frigidus]|nr:hypothetical protein T484DRAFT_1888874 [Cryptophyta sp. CCMP2293]
MQSSRKATATFSALDSTDVWNERNSLVLTFGEGVFFSDSSTGPGLSIDVAKLHRPPGVTAPGKPAAAAAAAARPAKAPAGKKPAVPRKKKEAGSGRARPAAKAAVELAPAAAMEPLVHLLHTTSMLVPMSPPREQKVVFTATPTQSPHFASPHSRGSMLLPRSPPQTPSGVFTDMYFSTQNAYPDSSSYLSLSGASPMVRGYRGVVLPSRDSLPATPDVSRMALPGVFASSGLPSADSAMGAAHRAPSQMLFNKGGRGNLVQGLAQGMMGGRMEMKNSLSAVLHSPMGVMHSPMAMGVMHSPMASPVRANSFLNLSSVPVTPVKEHFGASLMGGRREGSAEIFSSLKSPITAAMDSFMSLGGGRASLGSLGSVRGDDADFLICCEELP